MFHWAVLQPEHACTAMPAVYSDDHFDWLGVYSNQLVPVLVLVNYLGFISASKAYCQLIDNFESLFIYLATETTK